MLRRRSSCVRARRMVVPSNDHKKSAEVLFEAQGIISHGVGMLFMM